MTVLYSHSDVSICVESTTLRVIGDVSVALATDLAASGVKWLKNTELDAVTFDFSGLDKASSVAISVLFEWLRICQQRAITVDAIDFSEPLKRLASLAELDDLIENPSTTLAV